VCVFAPLAVAHFYSYFIHVSIMIWIGFGYLMTFLKRYGYSALGLNFVLSCEAFLWNILVRARIPPPFPGFPLLLFPFPAFICCVVRGGPVRRLLGARVPQERVGLADPDEDAPTDGGCVAPRPPRALLHFTTVCCCFVLLLCACVCPASVVRCRGVHDLLWGRVGSHLPLPATRHGVL
jgi:hypothetical protein